MARNSVALRVGEGKNMPLSHSRNRSSVISCAILLALLFAGTAASMHSMFRGGQQKSAPPVAQSRDLEFAVRGDMFAGMAGDTAAFDRAMKACESALASDPKNAVALVWHATGMYFRSSVAFRSGDVATGNSLREQARKEMDEGVALRPNSVDILVPRATVLQMQAAHTPDAEIARRVWQRSPTILKRLFSCKPKPLISCPFIHAENYSAGWRKATPAWEILRRRALI